VIIQIREACFGLNIGVLYVNLNTQHADWIRLQITTPGAGEYISLCGQKVVKDVILIPGRCDALRDGDDYSQWCVLN